MATTLTTSYQQIFSFKPSSYSTIKVYAKATQNTNDNTSSISMYATLSGSGNTGFFSSGTLKYTLDGQTQSYSLGNTTYVGKTITYSTFTKVRPHASDGTYTNKTISVSITTTGAPNGSGSGQINCKTIPRQNTIAVPDQADIGSTINIVIGKNSDNFRNTVTWTYNGSTQTVVDVNNTTLDKVTSGTYQWVVPTSIYSTIPNGKTADITFTNKTYSGTTKIGDDTTDTLTAKVPDSSKPTLTLTSKVETNSIVTTQLPASANDFTRPIINLSKPSFRFTARAYNSATLSSLTVTNGTNTRTVALSGTTQDVTYTFQNPMTNPIITFDVTDSRGLTMSTPYTFDGTSQQFTYVNPIFRTVKLSRPNITQSTVRAEISGSYTPKQLNGSTNNKIWVGFDSMEVGGQYSGTIEWYESGVSQNITLDTTNGTWSFDGNLVNKTALYDKSYYFKVYVKDSVTTTPQDFTYMLAKSVPTFSAGENDLQVNGDLYLANDSGNDVINLQSSLNMFNDTAGSTWQDMIKSKLDYCIDNIDTTRQNAETFINGGWQGRNFGCGIFSKIGTTSQLVWFSQYEVYYCKKDGNGYHYVEYYKDKDVIVCGINSNQSLTGTSDVKINMDTQRTRIGTHLTLDTTNKRITIGKDVHHVMVSGQVVCSAFTTNGLRRLNARKNGTQFARSMVYYTQNFDGTINLTPRLVEVQEGDYIEFGMWNAGNTTVYANDVDTYFVVEKVD